MNKTFSLCFSFFGVLAITALGDDLLAAPSVARRDEIAPESREAVLSEYLKRSDTVLFVCVYESQFTPIAVGKGVLWDKAYQCRIVQSLRGNIPVGSLLTLIKKAESIPEDGMVKTEGEKRFITSQGQGTLWYIFLDSDRMEKLRSNNYKYTLDTMWQNPLAWNDLDGMAAFRKLLNIEPARITEESEAARFRKDEEK